VLIPRLRDTVLEPHFVSIWPLKASHICDAGAPYS
jgi:hypothetical protein